MGVPSYFAYLIRNHKEMLIKLVSFKKQINNLYFDSNSIIYDALRVLSKDYAKYKRCNCNISKVHRIYSLDFQL